MQGSMAPESAFVNRAISNSDAAEDNGSAVEDMDDYLPDVKGEAVQAVARRPPPVNSDYLPLPWKGRLGYVSHPPSLDVELRGRTLTGIERTDVDWNRLASIPIFELLIRRFSVLAHVESHPFWKTATP
jgi:hypothetical protein